MISEQRIIWLCIDPVLGDNGNLYSTMDQKLVEGMKRLVTKADIITPNFTEVSLLLGEEYKQTTTDGRNQRMVITLV